MQNYISAGNTIRFTAGAAYSAGDAVQVGGFNGVVQDDVANGATGILAVIGVFKVAKLAGAAIDQGDALYLNSSKEVTKTPGSLKFYGIAAEAALSAATTMNVLLVNVGDAQKNSLITKAEIEAKLTGVISTHSH